MSWPSMKMRPSLGLSNPASMRSSVVFPQPEPPRSANISPFMMSSETSLTAVNVPKRLLTPSMRMKGCGPFLRHDADQPDLMACQARVISRSCSSFRGFGAHRRCFTLSSG